MVGSSSGLQEWKSCSRGYTRCPVGVRKVVGEFPIYIFNLKNKNLAFTVNIIKLTLDTGSIHLSRWSWVRQGAWTS